MRVVPFKASLCAASALGILLPSAAFAQSVPAENDERAVDDIIVTARRIEERLQDVPISITVYNAEQIANRNIAVATDLATYTPSLSVNQRFGAEKATFSIRGFNQDQATAPTVGVYFAEVVGVRAQGGTTSGNTVGAGAFTDLQNVQVLKGPQGTLQGRNTTGGAILLVPTKPTGALQGYVEGSIGNYDMRRVQAALNVPLADTFKVRLSVDRNKRDGFMHNHSGIGPNDYNDLNYTYARLSIVADLTPELENYTIFQYSNSDTNGYAGRIVQCNPNARSPLAGGGATYYATALAACDQLGRQNARGDGLRDVEVNSPDPFFRIKQWQVINTTTWQASDTLTIKNIASYGEFRERSSFSLNSDNFFVPNNATTQILAGVAGWRPGQRFQYILLDTSTSGDVSSQSTATEELQFQGRSADGKLNWVAGGYLEFSRPIGWNANRVSVYGHCTDVENLVCTQPLGFGAIIDPKTKFSFDNHGIFAQGTYNFTDKLALTLGGRYTFDSISGVSESTKMTLLPNGARILACNDGRANGGRPPVDSSQCRVVTGQGGIASSKSKRPTWLINLEYKPSNDAMIYAKWARGYRQGGLNFTNPGIESWGPEKVEAYEVGAKATFGGAVRGYFNIAGFYNDFSNQQIFASLIAKPGSGLAGGAAIINAGKSEIYGVEVDSSVTLFDSLRFDVGYTYLHTKLKELVPPTLDPGSPFSQIIPSGTKGDPLSLSPKHRLTVTGTYTLPLDKSIGAISVAGTYTYTSSQLPATVSPLGLPASNLVNANLNWNRVLGSPIDVSLFATNLTNKSYAVSVGGAYNSAGFESIFLGQPRMYGLRVRYSFGN